MEIDDTIECRVENTNVLLERNQNGDLKSHLYSYIKNERDQLPSQKDQIFIKSKSGWFSKEAQQHMHVDTLRANTEIYSHLSGSELMTEIERNSAAETNENLSEHLSITNENSSRNSVLSLPYSNTQRIGTYVDVSTPDFSYMDDVRTSTNSTRMIQNSIEEYNHRGEQNSSFSYEASYITEEYSIKVESSSAVDSPCIKDIELKDASKESNSIDRKSVNENSSNFSSSLKSRQEMNGPALMNFRSKEKSDTTRNKSDFDTTDSKSPMNLMQHHDSIMDDISSHHLRSSSTQKDDVRVKYEFSPKISQPAQAKERVTERKDSDTGTIFEQNTKPPVIFTESSTIEGSKESDASDRKNASPTLSTEMNPKQLRSDVSRIVCNHHGHRHDKIQATEQNHEAQNYHRRVKSLDEGYVGNFAQDHGTEFPTDHNNADTQQITHLGAESGRDDARELEINSLKKQWQNSPAQPSISRSTLQHPKQRQHQTNSQFYPQKYPPHTQLETNSKHINNNLHVHNSTYGQSGTRMLSHFDEQTSVIGINKQIGVHKQNTFKLPPRSQNVNIPTHHHNSYHHPHVPLQQQKQRRHHSMQQSGMGPSLKTSIQGMTMSSHHNGPSINNHNNPHVQNRTSPDILKTLLRKKACLYEADTSRAIALITWLVGRRMALSLGYFSRQQLQSGVHFVVSPKISAGIITRTKVNRCMQIILNSCFHYIIPRPDGGEEKGDSFRKHFAATVGGLEDENLVQALPIPWNDLNVGKALEEWLDIAEDHEEEDEGSDGYHKRAVLLCFNENVRSSDDVFRCHNEFIRDAANSANLLLTAEEWRIFFAGGTDQEGTHREIESAPSSPTLRSPAHSPRVKLMPSDVGIMHAPHLMLPSASSSAPASPLSSAICPIAKTDESPTDEMLGRMSAFELGKFRTTWCSKRYEHDPSRCGFAHVDINRGWLRRDPQVHPYRDELCPYIYPTAANSEKDGFLFNACPHGVNCEYAHSPEEMDYHPNQYKMKICQAHASGANGTSCELRDICPHLHPSFASAHREQYSGRAQGAFRTASSMHYNHQSKSHFGTLMPSQNRRDVSNLPQSSQGAGPRGHSGHVPKGAPMLYVDPAPFSDFDRYLLLPGLQSLFRTRCSTMWAHFCGKDKTKYKYF